MPEQGFDPRPGAEAFEVAGCRVTLVDPAGILAAARVERVELLRGAQFPPPVRQARLFVVAEARDGHQVHALTAKILTGPGDLTDRLGMAVLGLTSPVGVLLARRIPGTDQLTSRIADGVGTAAAEVSRRLGLGRPGGTRAGDDRRGNAATSPRPGPRKPAGPATVREDEAVGLRATVTHEEVPPPVIPALGRPGRMVTVRAAVPSEAVSPAHLRAMVTLVIDLIAELAGDPGPAAGSAAGSAAGPPDPLAGRSYVVSRLPASGSTGADGSEHVRLDQVGGLADVVAQFRQIALSFHHPRVMARWGARRPQGILLYGPPGTGKTMLARALANEIGASFREIRTPEILDKWLGASERNIKRIFREARRYREPTVMLFDEFDSIISYAGEGGDAASQAVNAVAGIFKQEMNSLIEDNPNVIVVATTNFPHRVDESLTRSGRFDIKIAIPLPDQAGRAEIFVKMVRELVARHEVAGFRMFAGDLDPAELARVSPGMTGADIKEVLRRVQLEKAMQEARTGVAAPPISQEDLRRGILELGQAGAAG
ncbi:MAG TPA: ATP-binding protein [Micromonosporaceae bacterium]|nr:ATP-binding protein [Micromonosporaceae bacterium]